MKNNKSIINSLYSKSSKLAYNKKINIAKIIKYMLQAQNKNFDYIGTDTIIIVNNIHYL